MTAMTNTRTPIPPTQCVRLRQKSGPFSRASTSLNMVAPVVVKPETVSKKQSKKLGMEPERRKGSAPKSDMAIHARATMTKPSLAYMVVSAGSFQRRSMPAAKVITMVMPNACTAFSP